MARLVYQNTAAPDFSGSLQGFNQMGRLLSAAADSSNNLFTNLQGQQAEAADRALAERALAFQDPAALSAALADGSLVGDQAGRASAGALAALGQQVGQRTAQAANLDALSRTRSDNAARDAAKAASSYYIEAAMQGNAPNAQNRYRSDDIYNLPIQDQIDLAKAGQNLLSGDQSRQQGEFNLQSMRDADKRATDLATAGNTIFRNSYNGPTALAQFGQQNNRDPRVEAALREQLSSLYPDQFNPNAQGATGGFSGSRSGGSSRGERNNNPGNIEDRGQFQGMPGYLGSDGRFARFSTPEAGQKAQQDQLLRYMQGKTTGRALTTVNDIVSTWSPASDPGNAAGSTQNYANYVAQRLGVDPNAKLTEEDIPRLASAMGEFETGNTVGNQLSNPLTAADAIADVARADTMANSNSSNRALEQLAGSSESRAEAAGRLTSQGGKDTPGGAFSGYTRGEVAEKLRDIEARAKVNPAQAARILEDSVSGRSLVNSIARQIPIIGSRVAPDTWDNALIDASIDSLSQIRQDGSANRDRQATAEQIQQASERINQVQTQLNAVRARASQLKSPALYQEADRLEKQLTELKTAGANLSRVQQGTQRYTATDLEAPARAARAAALLDPSQLPVNLENLSANDQWLYTRGLLPDWYARDVAREAATSRK